jgi:hypothetical protein
LGPFGPGPGISGKLLYLCLKHYDLASTTVTGIPMKEEQNASRLEREREYFVSSFLVGQPVFRSRKVFSARIQKFVL